VSTKIKAQRKVNDTQIFVDEVETQLREKLLRGSQTSEFHYSEDIARYRGVQINRLPPTESRPNQNWPPTDLTDKIRFDSWKRFFYRKLVGSVGGRLVG